MGKLVSKINFDIIVELQEPWDRRGYFEKLADCCPNAKAITSKKSCPWLWKRLRILQRKWKNLQEIPRLIYIDDIEVYTETAFEFNDRLINQILVLNSTDNRTLFLSRDLHTKLLSDLAAFKCLKYLEINRVNVFRLEEVDEILDTCPTLVDLTVIRRCESNTDNRVSSENQENSSPGILDKINLLKPKINLKKLF